MRLLMVVVGCLQNFLMGGVIFGWAAISNGMLVSNNGAPGLHASNVHKMFIYATTANMCSPLFLGIVLDKLGPRACSVLSIFVSFLGFLLFGLASTLESSLGESGGTGGGGVFDLWSKEFLITVSVVSIGFGGPGVQNSVIHLGNLFPARKGMVTAIITGCFQLSFCIFFVFDQIWSPPLSLQPSTRALPVRRTIQKFRGFLG